MPDARLVRDWDEQRLTAANAVAIGELWQLADGKAAVSTQLVSTGERCDFHTSGKFTITKATGVVLLDGGRAYWDHSANNGTYKKVGDRDFYAGRVVGDASGADTTVVVDLNSEPRYDIDIATDAYRTVIVGTQALGGLGLLRRGGCHNFILNATNEAQKLDILSVDSFSKNSNAIVELAFRVVSDGAGTVVDASLGIGNGTHATDADSITNHLLVHLDANDVDINLQSKDGTTTVTATDTTIDYTEGSALAQRVEVWFDLRNPADVQCYVNGALVLGSTVFDLSAAGSEFQLLAHIEKTSSTDTYELDLDWLRVRFAEQ